MKRYTPSDDSLSSWQSSLKAQETQSSSFTPLKTLGKWEKIFGLGLIALISTSVIGAGINSLRTKERTSETQKTDIFRNTQSTQDSQTQYSSNPNIANPNSNPSATPQLSKEYIYAGSRMLAVEDANANAAEETK